MSEETPAYVVTMTQKVPYCVPWLCENCGELLGMAVDGHVSLVNMSVLLKTDSVVVFCRECGAANTWMFNKEGGQ